MLAQGQVLSDLEEPTIADCGDTAVIVAPPRYTVKVIFEDMPPPGSGLTTLMAWTAGARTRPEGMLAVSAAVET